MNGIVVKRYFDKSLYTLYTRQAVFPFNSDKVRAFDLDSTLIQTRSGKIHSIDSNDYQWCKGVLPKLKELSDNNYVIPIFSNQNRIKFKQIYVKITNLFKELEAKDINTNMIVFFLAAKYDWNRKPSPSMWNMFVHKFNGGKIPTDSLFVGDAAGRPNDFSCSDRKFAHNARLKFFTPEQYFLGQLTPDDSQPINTLNTNHDWLRDTSCEYPSSFNPSDKQEMIVCVGFPGAGKSSWFDSNLRCGGAYEYINQDTLKTPGKCKKVCTDSLAAGKSVFIDNTNLSANTRKQYIDIAKKFNIPVRCVFINTNLELCKHLNKCRSYLKKTTAVPHVAYNNAAKSFVQPNVTEGFTEIITVPFAPKFNNDRELRVFKYKW